MRPADYRDEDWVKCAQCEGQGSFEGQPWGAPTYRCSNCSGAGGWPATATRHDDEKDEA